MMNIMYVLLKKYLKNIGLRMAVGGKESDILMQFLIRSHFNKYNRWIYLGVFQGLKFNYIYWELFKLANKCGNVFYCYFRLRFVQLQEIFCWMVSCKKSIGF